MKNTFGDNLSVTIFGESHGKSVGAVIDGLCAGIDVNLENINKMLSLRRPQDAASTARRENDEFTVHSGVFNDKTCGTPICITIENSDTRSKDYSKTYGIARPSHADFTAFSKYNGCEDYRGGGHFSGRITAALCAVGGILIPALNKKGIYIGTHIKKIGSALDRDFDCIKDDINKLSNKYFAVLDDAAEGKMRAEIINAKNDGDSIGGMLETVVYGLSAGIGEPFFDSLESKISHAVFSVPAVKGIEFGLGFGFCDKRGSEVNDAFYIENGEIKTKTNNSGGINGGISNSMPVLFKTAIRPTPTISKEQQTVDFLKGENAVLKANGRHDPCIVHRARAVLDAVTAIAVTDALITKFGTDWLGEK